MVTSAQQLLRHAWGVTSWLFHASLETPRPIALVPASAVALSQGKLFRLTVNFVAVFIKPGSIGNATEICRGGIAWKKLCSFWLDEIGGVRIDQA